MRRVKSPTRLLPGFRNDKVAVALPQLEPAKAGVDIRTENGRSRSAKRVDLGHPSFLGRTGWQFWRCIWQTTPIHFV